MPTWYPSCKVRFLVRFEDFLPTPATPSPFIPGEPEAFGGETFQALKFDIVPYDCSVTLNSYREADQATITVPFVALPFDPRILRAVAIQIFMGTIDPQNYADGMGPTGGKATLTLVPDSQDPTKPSLSNEIFRGFVDSIEVNQDGDNTITIECRDQTALFLDAEVNQQSLQGLPKDLPLDLLIGQILIGEPTALGLPQPQALKWSVAERQTIRGNRRLITERVAALTAKLAKLNAALAQALKPGDIALITAEIATVTALQSTANAALTAATISESTTEAIPLLAQRFGLPGARGTLVVNETRFPIMPSLGEIKGVKYFDSKGTAKKSKSAGKKRMNYWDLITDLCVAAGFICYIRRSTEATPGGFTPPPQLVITEPRTYYGETLPGGLPNPNAISPINLHEFAYGYNIDTLTLERNLTGKNAPQAIQVQARVAETGDLIAARFPPNLDPTGVAPQTANRAAPSNLGDRVEVMTMNYRGEIPEARAEEIMSLVAEKVYEEVARGEFRVTISTRELSFRPLNLVRQPPIADIFELKSGDSIRIGNITNATPDIEKGLVNQAGMFKAMPFAERLEAFVKMGLSAVAAFGAATAYENPLFPEIFRVRTVGLDFNHNDGFKIEVEAVNYLDARNALNVAAPGS